MVSTPKNYYLTRGEYKPSAFGKKKANEFRLNKNLNVTNEELLKVGTDNLEEEKSPAHNSFNMQYSQ
jgi:hypothetical protein